MKDKFDPNLMKDSIRTISNAGGKHMFNNVEEEVIQVQIRPDDKVKPSLFMPDPFIPGGYKAHPSTIRAMRADIFVLGNDMFEDFQSMHVCEGCQNELDLQFWYFCPHCEEPFPEELLVVKKQIHLIELNDYTNVN